MLKFGVNDPGAPPDAAHGSCTAWFSWEICTLSYFYI